MPITMTLEQERKLKARAERAKKPVEAVLDDLLTENRDNDAIQKLIPEGAVYSIESPYDCHEAAHIMMEVLGEYKANQVEQTK